MHLFNPLIVLLCSVPHHILPVSVQEVVLRANLLQSLDSLRRYRNILLKVAPDLRINTTTTMNENFDLESLGKADKKKFSAACSLVRNEFEGSFLNFDMYLKNRELSAARQDETLADPSLIRVEDVKT